MITKVVISPDNKKAIAFFNKLREHKAVIKSEIAANASVKKVKAEVGR